MSASPDSSRYSECDSLSPSAATVSSNFSNREFIHDDLPKDMTLDVFTRQLCHSNVYQMFSNFKTVILSEEKGPFYDQFPQLNRYADIPCVKNTRVKVLFPDQSHDYIHANYVDGFREKKKFILTQAPIDSTIEQFWQMIWNERSAMVISFTPLDGVKCPLYIPIKSEQKLKIGKFEIVNSGTHHIRETYDATILKVSNGGDSTRKILHLTFYSWPAKGTPTRPTEVLQFLDDVNFNRKILIREAIESGWLPSGQTSPIIMHCIAGVGRSGSFATLDICARRLDATFEQPSGPLCNVHLTIFGVRHQRAFAVQKPEQYLFVHMAIIEYALRKRYYDNVDGIILQSFMVEEDENENI